MKISDREFPSDEKAKIRFWKKVDKNGPIPEHRPWLNCCWIWTGATYTHGYGQFSITTGISTQSTRVVYEWEYGKYDRNLQVLHKCDNPSCVRPSHLFLGTQKDNIQDAISKGRGTNGSRNGACKLTPEQIKSIRERYKPRPRGHRAWDGLGRESEKLASEFGVCAATIESAAKGIRYKDVG